MRPSNGVDAVLLLFWLVAVVANIIDTETVLTSSCAEVLLVALGATVEESVVGEDGPVSVDVNALLFFIPDAVIRETGNAEVVLVSASIEEVLLLFVVLGAVFSETDEAVLSAGVDKRPLVWLVAVVADAMEAEAVLTFSTADVGAVVDATMDDEIVTLFVKVDSVLLLVVLGFLGGAVGKAVVEKERFFTFSIADPKVTHNCAAFYLLCSPSLTLCAG